MWMKGILLAVAVAAGVVVSPASAHDHLAPNAVLLVGQERQQGIQYHADWVKPPDTAGDCTAEFLSGFPLIGRPLLHPAGELPVVRLQKSAAPLEIEVQRWPRTNDEGYARGKAVPLQWTLRPHTVAGSIKAWDVVIVWPETTDQLYLGVGAYWADQQGVVGFPTWEASMPRGPSTLRNRRARGFSRQSRSRFTAVEPLPGAPLHPERRGPRRASGSRSAIVPGTTVEYRPNRVRGWPDGTWTAAHISVKFGGCDSWLREEFVVSYY